LAPFSPNVQGSPFDLLFCVNAPALSTGQLPDGETLTYSLVTSNVANFGSIATSVQIGVQKGAGGAGVPAQILAAKFPGGPGSFWGLQIVASSAAAASGVGSVVLYLAVFN
jgi:hypothetical protein